jgi:hypothetical protein
MGGALARTFRFVVMEGPPTDYPAKFRTAVAKAGIHADVETFPHMYSRGISRRTLGHIRDLLVHRHPEEVVFFCPGALELFLEEPDMSFHFSGYRSWFDPSRIAVLPHPWTAVALKPEDESPGWSGKPALNVGFMGTTYADSRVARMASVMPRSIKRRILEGRLRKNANRVASLYEHGLPFHFLPTFARFEALEAVARAPWPPNAIIEIVNSGGFDASATKKDAFAEHLRRMTYVLCPRGCENYSFRVYEALRFGRVPVIIDTDMVFPGPIDWDEIAVVVPGNSPEKIHERVIEDYRSLDAKRFIARQEAALAAGAFFDSEAWLVDAVRDAVATRDTLPLAANGG